MKWRRRLWLFAPYLLVVGVAFAGLHGLEGESHQRCLDRQADRSVLRQVVTISTTSSSGSLDLTQIDGFDQLDPASQFFMRALTEKLAQGSPTARQQLREQLLAQLPPINC